MPEVIGLSAPRLRCLWLTRLDPIRPDAGDLTYSYHLLSSLAGAGAHLTVLAVARPGDYPGRRAADGIKWVLIAPTGAGELRGRLAVSSLFRLLPNVAVQYKTAAFRRALSAQLARRWDVVIVDHIGVGWTWPRIEAYRRRHPNALSVFIAHQCEGEVRRQVARDYHGNALHRLGMQVDAVKASMLERRIVRGASLFSAITAADRDRLGSHAKSLLLTPGYAGLRRPARRITATTPRRALLFGSALWIAKQMNLTQFLAAADELFACHDIELWVVGKVPGHLRDGNRFRATRFLGYVEDPAPIFDDMRIGIVAEQSGGGFKLKSLDYVFNRVPIAALAGSIAGLPLAPDRDYLSFETLPDLARGIVAAIDDVEQLNALQDAAYARCSPAFDWRERGQVLLAAMQRALRLAEAVPIVAGCTGIPGS
jgi:glycosyltransferase involved in cell wall biosynthesis